MAEETAKAQDEEPIAPDEAMPAAATKPPKKKKRRKKKAPKEPVPREVAIRHVMQANTGKDTKPELKVRAMLREMGWPGYRLQWKKAAGKPDIAFPGRKIAIFVNGCFWHRHEGCKKASTPKTNVEFWQAKFDRNVARDKRSRETLEAEGWTVITIWECELEKDKLEQTSTMLYEVMSLSDQNESVAPTQ